jgi:hydrogenase nickel incorporation protein HypA/HybF
LPISGFRFCRPGLTLKQLQMHEVGLMQNALELAAERTRAAGATRIHRLVLRVGALSGVVPEALESAFAVLSPGSLADGARLQIETVGIVGWCECCQAEFPSGDQISLCPKCGEPSAAIRRGRELELAQLEIS